MEVHLKPEQEIFIQHSVREGTFATLDEAVQAAVDLLEERERATQVRPSTRKSLVQLFAESPFRGLDIDFPRDQSPMRDVDL